MRTPVTTRGPAATCTASCCCRSAGAASCCLMILLSLLSCSAAPTTNTVVYQAQSPDGSRLAILVDRYYHAARVSDGFFLIVLPRGQGAGSAINARNIGDSAALVATGASKVHMSWQNSNTLTVVCDACGLKPIDISKELGHLGDTKIVYRGFPEHTAYE